MRNVERHKYAVARQPNADDETIVEWFWEQGFVQPTSATSLLSRDAAGAVVQQEEIKIKTRGDKPTILTLVDSQGGIDLRPDFIYWNGKYWGAAAQSQWLQMGRSGFNTYVGQYNSRASQPAIFGTPPAFAEEYDAFIEAVGSVERVVELPLQSLINKIGA